MAAIPPPGYTPPPTQEPQRGDRSTFSIRLDAFITWLKTGFSDMSLMVANVYANAQSAFTSAGAASGFADNAQGSAGLANDHKIAAGNSATAAAASAASALNAPGTSATSTTSLTIGLGLQTLTLAQTGKSFTPGQTVVIPSIASPGNQMTGVITAFNAGTGAMTVNVSSVLGAGTFASWAVALSGKQGDAGAIVNPLAIGSLIAMSQTANLVTQNGYDYLKTGVLASAASYAAAPLQDLFADSTRLFTSGAWTGVAFGKGIVVVVSSGTAGQISYDLGRTWSPITLPSAGYTAITFGNDLFVAIGGGVCATSTDGVNWVNRNASIPAETFTAIHHNGVNFIAVAGASGTQRVGIYSANGASWTISTLPSSQNWGALTSGNGLVLATVSSGNTNVCASSADNGATWATRTLPKSFAFEKQNSAFGLGKFVVLTIDPTFADTNCVFTTTDCINWEIRNYGAITNNTKTLSFVGGIFIGTRAGSTNCYLSKDGGITWSVKTQSVAHAPSATTVVNGGQMIGVASGSGTVDIYTMAYGRGYHVALFADPQNQAIPLYMRMS
ncbi:MAG: hypothetical protein WA071_14755 [Undibacterium umbellatum]|uniref:WD40/YVTN/BNR-like repeat-containing protein n=1 Tax=Undibacterium umbellatum TaxID=2762300 RepID=UPI003BB6FB07